MPSSVLSLIPAPRSYKESGGPFFAGTLVLSSSPVFIPQIRSLRDDIEELFGATLLYPLSSAEEFAWADLYSTKGSHLWGANFRDASVPTLKVELSLDSSFSESSYTLCCSPDGVLLRAATSAGAAAACSTFLQILHGSWDGWRFRVPSCVIEDEPSFSWRGFMIDSSRHFVPLKDMKRLVRLAALYKINRLHWHLSDDQGWRIELLNMPMATDAGSTRSGHDPHRNGFYTQKEAKELVEYASDRGVTIVPELDLPGHAQAILACDPDLACDPGPYAVRSKWGISDDVLCMGNPRSLEFAKAAWDEVCSIFPGPYVHIGGDECPTTRWESCPRCQARKAELGLPEWVDLHGRFVNDIAEHLRSKGRTVFGWDEVLDSANGVGSNVVHWRAWLPDRSAEALRRGLDLIRSPFSPYYFDFIQTDNRSVSPGLAYKTPQASTLRRVYEFDPFENLPPDSAREETGRGRLLGVQANAWTEFMRDPRRVEYMVFPRLLAFAETAWLGSARPGWEDFRARLDGGRRILDRLSVNYCPIEFQNGDAPSE